MMFHIPGSAVLDVLAGGRSRSVPRQVARSGHQVGSIPLPRSVRCVVFFFTDPHGPHPLGGAGIPSILIPIASVVPSTSCSPSGSFSTADGVKTTQLRDSDICSPCTISLQVFFMAEFIWRAWLGDRTDSPDRQAFRCCGSDGDDSWFECSSLQSKLWEVQYTVVSVRTHHPIGFGDVSVRHTSWESFFQLQWGFRGSSRSETRVSFC